ncbi:hypothetical protein [Sphingomonas sp. ID0503]|uniref:hypothetical protein n=1 Tax=Sphingomonas sp. ID0503 TaxID=3399691 RepID=UPI003AFA608F
MSFVGPIVPDALAGADRWQCATLQQFAWAERHVVRALSQSGLKVSAGTPLGGKITALLTALSADPSRAPAVALLAEYGGFKPLRDRLCHGLVKVFAARDGDWVIRLMLPTETEADALLLGRQVAEAQRRRVQSWASKLGSALDRISFTHD